MKKLVLVFIFSTIVFNSFAIWLSEVITDTLCDGPYIFYMNDSLTAKTIENGELTVYTFSLHNYHEFQSSIKLSCSYNDFIDVFKNPVNFVQNFTGVDSLVAISDVHGQFGSYKKQLIAHGVIDENLNWKFGTGHLVFNGDACDRGDEVTELLWHLFILEKQAIKAGGKVHVLLGNHESMVLDADLRYISNKYKSVESIAKTSYSDLFSETSVLGRWLRDKPVVISINDILFVHAGISIDLVRSGISLNQINKLFSNNIIGKGLSENNPDQRVELLSGNQGPIWYRGYFDDTTFTEIKLDSILSYYKASHLVVGHTTFKKLKVLYNSKIIGIDAGIGYGWPGEILIYKKGIFYRGNFKGERFQL